LVSVVWAMLLAVLDAHKVASGTLGDDGWVVTWRPCRCWHWVRAWVLVDGAGTWSMDDEVGGGCSLRVQCRCGIWVLVVVEFGGDCLVKLFLQHTVRVSLF